MEFQDYVSLICSSVAEQGYEMFFPCACIPAEKISMRVLEIDLSPEGDKEATMNWISENFQDHPVVFFAYRAGNRKVHICRLEDWEIKKRVSVLVEPPED
jgi:hypothetical protein